MNKIFGNQQISPSKTPDVNDLDDLEMEGLETVEFDSLANFVATSLTVEEERQGEEKNILITEARVEVLQETTKRLEEEVQSFTVDLSAEPLFVIDTTPQDISEKLDPIIVGERIQNDPLF